MLLALEARVDQTVQMDLLVRLVQPLPRVLPQRHLPVTDGQAEAVRVAEKDGYAFLEAVLAGLGPFEKASGTAQ